MRYMITLVSFGVGGLGVALLWLFISPMTENQPAPDVNVGIGAMLVLVGWLTYQGSGKITGE